MFFSEGVKLYGAGFLVIYSFLIKESKYGKKWKVRNFSK